jgi:hypothetical protein
MQPRGDGARAFTRRVCASVEFDDSIVNGSGGASSTSDGTGGARGSTGGSGGVTAALSNEVGVSALHSSISGWPDPSKSRSNRS